MKTPPATVLIKKASKVDKGSQKPHTDKVGKLTRAQAEEIAKTKHARPHRRRSRRRRAHDRRQRAQHGHHRRRSEVIMAEQKDPQLSKRMKAVRGKVDRSEELSGRRRAEDRQGNGDGEVRRVRRRRRQPRRRCQEVGPDGARLGRAARGHRQEGARRRVRPGRQGQGGAGCRRRYRRLRRSGGEDQGRLHGFRRRHRVAGCDARRRPARARSSGRAD